MESLVASPGSTSPKPSGTDAFAIDPLTVVEYLASVLEITLGATRKELESFGSLLSPDSRAHTVQRCSRFASENQVALYVTKDIASAGVLDGVIDNLGTYLSAHSLRRHTLTYVFRYSNLQLHPDNGHFILTLNDCFDRASETAFTYRPNDTHFFASTNY